MTDEITDEFSKEELEEQIAAQLPDREAMSILPIAGPDAAFADLELGNDPPHPATEHEPLKGPEPA
jgi:hypothetical protein